MKPLLLSLALVILSACGGTVAPSSRSSSSRYVFRVNHTLDKSKGVAQLPDNLAYEASQPTDRWDVAIEGTHVELTPLTPVQGGKQLEGNEVKGTTAGERRFEITQGVFAGAQFIMRGPEDAELTIFGSGVPVVSSERGKLVAR